VERIARIYHGTTVMGAQAICKELRFDVGQDLYFVLGAPNADLARIFARRAASRRTQGGGPAVVTAQVEETAFDALRRKGLLRLLPFDPEDRPELVNRNQWKLERPAVMAFNAGLVEADWHPIDPRSES
jgi:hypothetical protein